MNHALREPQPEQPAMQVLRLPRAAAGRRDLPYCHHGAMPLEERAQHQMPSAHPLISCRTKP
jgi:hypothetical protein